MIDKFNTADFETALPNHKATGKPLWTALGLIDGEHAYLVKPFPEKPYGIMVRSSIGQSGWSADTGEDSIRCWLVGPDNAPWGSKVVRWTTRLPKWQERLLAVLRELARSIVAIRQCPKCHADMKVFRNKATKELFNKCPKCSPWKR